MSDRPAPPTGAGGVSERRGWLHRRLSLRARLLIMALLPLLVVMPLLLGTSLRSWMARFDTLLIAKVAGDLTIAHQHLSGLTEGRVAALDALARSAEFARARQEPARLAAFLTGRMDEVGVDFLYLVDAGGRVEATDRPGARPDPDSWPVVSHALAGRATGAIDVLSQGQMQALSPELAARALVRLVPTRNAAPYDRPAETRGMFVHVAAPAAGGGALVGGLLLNHNLDFIDALNRRVYPDSAPGGQQGTATLFLDDVRVSTNVRMFAGERALGTRVSQAVRGAVLERGQVWQARAFVVNDWYLSAYEPIADSFGNRAGMLYVGFREAPFVEMEHQALLRMTLVFLGVAALSVPVLLLWAHAIFRPVERMGETITRVEAGDLGARSGVRGEGDEIGRLARHLDDLLDQLQERDRRLRGWNEALEARVAERTQALEEANRQVELTARQLIVSEKLAALGEITAGLAHEINNPLAVIQGNLEVILADLGRAAEPLSTEFALIQDQVQAIHMLVSKLLSFARPEEYAGTGDTDPDAVIRGTIPLVQHLFTRGRIEIEVRLAAGARVGINQPELQQVLVNLLVNAAQAMPGGGRLVLASSRLREAGRDWVRIEVEDSGPGIAPALLSRVFDPFFTTKQAQGTGLGLSISRDLVQRAGGGIRVENLPQGGCRFTVTLPVAEGEAMPAMPG